MTKSGLFFIMDLYDLRIFIEEDQHFYPDDLAVILLVVPSGV